MTVIATTHLWERFSFWGMQALLMLYMTKYLLLPEHAAGVIGLDWVKAHVFPGLDGQPLASATIAASIRRRARLADTIGFMPAWCSSPPNGLPMSGRPPTVVRDPTVFHNCS